MGEYLLIVFVFLVAGIAAVPLAARFGLGSVLGYLIAGIAIAPILQVLSVDVRSIQHFAEFGVVMMLFLVGLELEPRLLWAMRARLLGLGGLQVLLTVLAVTGVAMAFGLAWNMALAIGMVLTMSSTAIVLQTLNEKGLMRGDGGQASFQVLLFQDIAVIPMLAVIPLLALPELADTAHGLAAGAGHGGTGHGDVAPGDSRGGGLSLTAGLPGWAQALVTLGAIGVVLLGGTYLTRPVFRYIAAARLRELFTAAALMMVIGIALLMTLVGLSPALGTFLAGVVLANSEYRHELESDIDPFKGLLLGLFFITVGASIDFGLMGANVALVLALTLGLIALKAGVILVLSLVFKVPGADRWLFALGLAQAGEFGFVLLSFTVASAVLPQSIADLLLLVVALSMLLTPGLFILFDRVIAPRFGGTDAAKADDIPETGPVIIAGHGRFGGVVNRLLRTAGIETVVLDYNSAQLEMLRTFGVKVYFGDASRPDLLHAAGIAEARLLVVAIDDRAQCTEIVRYVKQTHPKVQIVARARDRGHVFELWAAGCRSVVRDTFDSSLRAGRSSLEYLGFHPFDAERLSRSFEDKDRQAIRAVADVYDPGVPIHKNTAYVERTRQVMRAHEDELRNASPGHASRDTRAWSPPTQADVAAVTDLDRRTTEG